MRTILTATLIVSFALSGCSTVSESRANPFNWFDGSSDEAPLPETPQNTNPLIPESSGFFSASREERARYKGSPVQQVTEVKIERVPGGILVLATGVTSAFGPYEPQLTPENPREEPVDGVLTYRLEALTTGNSAAGSLDARTVTVGRTIRNQELASTDLIRIRGVQNQIDVRPR